MSPDPDAVREAMDTAERLDRQWLGREPGTGSQYLPWMPFPRSSYIQMVAEALPAAPGKAILDVGCVDADSEYLAPGGWRRIADYDGGLVMQYDPETGNGSLVQPERYIVKPCDEFYDLHTKYGINQRLSAEHRVLFWKVTGTDRRLVPTVWTAEKFAAEHGRLASGVKGMFQTAFTPVLDTKIDLSPAEIRVQVMVNADGYLPRPGHAVLKFRKPRKVKRARELLSSYRMVTGVPYHESGPDRWGVTRFSFMPPWHTKSFAGFWKASAEQLAVVADECLHWDGSAAGARAGRFFTRDKGAADFIQYALTASGYRAVLREDRDGEGATDYRVFANTNTMTSMQGSPKTDIMTVPSEDGRAYCFTVPTGFWVMRRGGNIVMTGNCGIGTRMLLAQEIFGLRATGIELSPVYAEQAKALGLHVLIGDAADFPDYGRYGLIWLYRPMRDPGLQAALEKTVWDQMAGGAVLAGANLEAPPADAHVILDDWERKRGIWMKPPRA